MTYRQALWAVCLSAVLLPFPVQALFRIDAAAFRGAAVGRLPLVAAAIGAGEVAHHVLELLLAECLADALHAAVTERHGHAPGAH